MWLLRTEDMELYEFYKDIPRYAILSHRWGQQELTFRNVTRSSSRSLEGYHKVKAFCEQAQQRGFDYVWVDTCCINKLSSAELNEAINSMYRWYEEATVCYVYLSDIDQLPDLERSTWFTRGWTLQELLAPTEVHFYSREWKFLASRQQLAPTLEKVTGIPRDVLCRSKGTADFSVAERMSWAAGRETTRLEDQAYCLLGIFDVNMPLLYGEGEKAFQRLQEEIMKVSTDLSLFLWQGQSCARFGMLAASPSGFVNLPTCLKDPAVRMSCKLSNGWTVNNALMSIRVVLQPYFLTQDFKEVYALFLQETYSNDAAPGLCVFVMKRALYEGDNLYLRVDLANQTWTIRDLYNESQKSGLPLPEEQSVLISRGPIAKCSADGFHGINLRLKTTSPSIFTPYGRDLNNMDSELRHWPKMRPSSGPSLEFEYCFNVGQHRTMVGLLGYMIVAIAEGIEVLICLGLDDLFQPFCATLFLSRRNHARGIRPSSVLRTLFELLPRDKKQAFDPAICLFAYRRLHLPTSFQRSPDDVKGFDVHIRRRHDAPGMYEALVQFDVHEFLQIPNLTTAAMVKQALALESALYPHRLRCF